MKDSLRRIEEGLLKWKNEWASGGDAIVGPYLESLASLRSMLEGDAGEDEKALFAFISQKSINLEEKETGLFYLSRLSARAKLAEIQSDVIIEIDEHGKVHPPVKGIRREK